MNKKIKGIFSLKALFIVFFAFCIICAFPFSINLIVDFMQKLIHRSLRDIQKWQNVVQHAMSFFAFITAFLYFCIYTRKGNIFYKDGFSILKKVYFNKKALTGLIITSVIFIVAYWALLRTSYDYADDMRRVYSGHKAWVGWNRYISETLAVFIHTNFYINDIAPLTHLISIAILSAAAYLLAYILTAGKPGIMSIICSSFMAITPYYNQNFAYKFDSPYMALSILFGILPFIFTENRFNFIIASFFSLVMVCTSYQAANSIYIIMTVFIVLELVLQKKDFKEISRFTGTAILCYCAALIFFRIFLMNQIEYSGFIESSPTVGLGSGMIDNIIQNYKTYFAFVTGLYGNYWIKFFTILMAILFPFAVADKAQNNKKLVFVISVAALIFMILLSFGAYIVLTKPLISARAFMGLDVLISAVAIIVTTSFQNNKTAKKIISICSVCLLYGFIVSSTVFGNFYAKQQDYEHFRISILLEDLSKIVSPDASVKSKIYIGGTYGQAQKTRMEKKNYNLICGNTGALTEYLIKDWNMNVELVSELPVEYIDLDPALKNLISEQPLLIDTYYHSIYGKDNFYYIYLKNPEIRD